MTHHFDVEQTPEAKRHERTYAAPMPGIAYGLLFAAIMSVQAGMLTQAMTPVQTPIVVND